ncbi:glycerophosphodiester phosphodiesterase [Solirubrobacter sp. CPCC 204708]|uniref:glycerophosphodiester phosphodiesterase n=1 Tax=Solirubrobacter deserti TaxID=2282478 RepID=A0ABT4RJZ5_9ACTN|nr:glycerophosphodiester phosphodiesterase [Solirubrobacter deserti]MBE2315789.1 glycerophosphodiester phosphodiesterase [Solirubrobacter deserti]MDA0138874.1 glycerophosphodiester phosphodiesterase [Solirubrobacter deserti]
MHRRVLASAVAGVLALGLAVPAAEASRTWGSGHRGEPLVIGHRGASAYRPEHTLAAYQLAIDMGADYIEPDLVSTKDRVLVARHENEISGTTDVASRPEFANRRTTKTIDGTAITGWFTEDFTLAELKTLRAIERIPQLRPLNTAFNGLYQVPTLQEVIDLAKREDVGIYPETKHPTYFDSINLSLEEPLVRTLRANGLDRPNADVFVQSFEVSNLQELSRDLRVPIVQLTSAAGRPYDFTAKGDPRTYADLTSASGLRWVSRYADGLGPEKNQIVPRDAAGKLQAPTSLVNDAHRAGLQVHPYTFRPENNFLSADHREGDPASPEYPRARGNQAAELKLFFKLGVDGVFADNPDTAVAVRRKVFGR